MMKRAISLCLAIVLVLSAFSLAASAEDAFEGDSTMAEAEEVVIEPASDAEEFCDPEDEAIVPEEPEEEAEAPDESALPLDTPAEETDNMDDPVAPAEETTADTGNVIPVELPEFAPEAPAEQPAAAPEGPAASPAEACASADAVASDTAEAPAEASVSEEDIVNLTGDGGWGDISLSRYYLDLYVYDSYTIYAYVYPSYSTVMWSSSDENVAYVQNGEIYARAPGTAYITAETYSGAWASCEVYVHGVSVQGISLSDEFIQLEKGDSYSLYSYIYPSNATVKDTYWYSLNETVASVDGYGNVYARSAGSTWISAVTADGGYEAWCYVSVYDPTAPIVQVTNGRGICGRTMRVPISIANNPGIASIGFEVHYDTEAFRLTGISNGVIFGDNDIDGNIARVPFMFSAYNTKSDKTSNGDLVILEFDVLSTAPEGDYTIWVDSVEANNLAEKVVNFATIDGLITVTSTIPGDVNGDGVVSRLDLTRIAKYYAGYDVEIDAQASDVNDDGIVSRLDLTRLAKYFAGYDVKLGEK